MEVALPNNFRLLGDRMFPLHQALEKQYKYLPWPSEMRKIVVMTEVVGGRGDIATAAKVIHLLQQINNTLIFDWVLTGGRQYKPELYLKTKTNVAIRYLGSKPVDADIPYDLLIVGPVSCGWDIRYIQNRISRTIVGATFSFQENGSPLAGIYSELLSSIAGRDYSMLHPYIFAPRKLGGIVRLPMGLRSGSGVFLNSDRLNITNIDILFPSEISDAKLREDIIGSDSSSFNFGYAHRPESWGKFIDCVAIHEKDRSVMIVLNQHGEFNCFNTKTFWENIVISRIPFLRSRGYGNIILQGHDERYSDINKNGRNFTIIIRESFHPDDMRLMQLKAERIMATGDNSSIESICSRCQLYLYEDVANCGCKYLYLQQQVDIAKLFSPNLSHLLEIFGSTKLNTTWLDEIEILLSDDNLTSATMKFCEHIINNYSFSDVIESSIKRVVWHHLIPSLLDVEVNCIDDDFKTGIGKYLVDQSTAEQNHTLSNLDAMGLQLQKLVTEYLANRD